VRTITIKLNTASINQAIKELKAYQKKVENAGAEIAKRLANLGYEVAYGIMDGHVFSGETIESLEVVDAGEGKFILQAGSQALLFFEFGAGVTYSSEKNPLSDEFGFGPGTYPNAKGHWNDPNGWWYETDDPRLTVRVDSKGQGLGHSYGNPPHMPFYKASKAMRDALLETAKEVLSE
jgi:hypothetical protein